MEDKPKHIPYGKSFAVFLTEQQRRLFSDHFANHEDLLFRQLLSESRPKPKPKPLYWRLQNQARSYIATKLWLLARKIHRDSVPDWEDYF